ncbi:MAG: DUF3990 domain-containing protein [Bacteroidales bacterium]|nr:DUF3990 domain-containing protein [Bacteroidales bacterium]
MKLYHGSTVNISEIDLSKSRPNKDFGKGFYLSANRQQALRMAEFKSLTEGGNPIINTYLFDDGLLNSNELKTLTFNGYTKEWAEFIFANRNNPTKQQVHDYDVVYGPIANDRVGVQISKYETGIISLEQFIENLKYMGGVTYQYFFGTDKAISKLKKI